MILGDRSQGHSFLVSVLLSLGTFPAYAQVRNGKIYEIEAIGYMAKHGIKDPPYFTFSQMSVVTLILPSPADGAGCVV